MIKRVLLLSFLAFAVVYTIFPTSIYAISLDDDEEDAEDVADLLEQAKKAGNSESFSEADTLLKKAEMYGVSTNDTQEASKYVSQQKQARDARLERERQAKLEAQRREREKQAVLSRQRTQRSNVYITNWGYKFQTGDSIWGINDVKLSNGRSFYAWLNKKTYGMKCYELFVQGGLTGSASNCSNSINNSWSASACGRSFWVTGDQVDVVKAIVNRCY